jgi:hypothetical protein
MAMEDPSHVRIGASVLTHRSFQTTEQHYIQAQMVQAHQSFTSFMVKKRQEIKKPQSNRGTG